MAFIHVKNTGNDTTGDGSFAAPYLTLDKCMTVHTQRDTIALLSDIMLATKVNMPVYAAYLINSIIGVNDAGVEDGTRRRIYGNGSCDYAFHFTANSYTWSWRNLDFDTFTEYVISNNFTYSYRSGMTNFSISNCKGLTNGLTFGFGSGGFFEDFEVYNCSSGVHCFSLQLGTIKNGSFRNCSAIQYIITGANGSVALNNVIITGCSVTQANFRIIGAVNQCSNVIIDRCIVPTSATSYLIQIGGEVRGLLITNCTVPTGNYLITYTTVVSTIANVAVYNTTSALAILGKVSGDALTKNIIQLTETPYQNDDGIDYTLKPSFAWRRKRFELGKFTNVLTPTGL